MVVVVMVVVVAAAVATQGFVLSRRQQRVINHIDEAIALPRLLAALALPQAHLLRARRATASAGNRTGFQRCQSVGKGEADAVEAALRRRQRAPHGGGEIDAEAGAWQGQGLRFETKDAYVLKPKMRVLIFADGGALRGEGVGGGGRTVRDPSSVNADPQGTAEVSAAGDNAAGGGLRTRRG